MKKHGSIIASVLLSAVLSLTSLTVIGQPLTTGEIDALAERTISTFDVPGIAVAIIKDGRLIHSSGYGVRSIATGKPVDQNTLFGIASNSKAFTVAALGILVDEGRLSWDDRVSDIIPGFRLYDPYVTQEFTVRDMLTHRSGLGLGAGDLMIWPGPNDFTKEEIIHNLRYLPQASGFRTKYDYDNLMYIVAGEVVRRVSGISWEEFVETRIMKPLGMSASAASYNRLTDTSNVIDPHAPINGRVAIVERHTVDVSNSAGGIYSNINDLSKWVIMHLNNGRYGDSNSLQLLSEDVHRTMWTPQTIKPSDYPGDYNTHFRCYGLGFNLSDVKGYLQVTHTGELTGMVTQITMIPELNLGIIVLTNQQSTAAFYAITNTILDSYLGVKDKDRVREMHDYVTASQKEARSITDAIWKSIGEQQGAETVKPDMSQYTGIYTDKWFGDVNIIIKDGRLRFESRRCPRISGDLYYYRGSVFIARWDDRSLDADAFVYFTPDMDGKPMGITMKPVSPLTDFSYDFQDLDFKRRE